MTNIQDDFISYLFTHSHIKHTTTQTTIFDGIKSPELRISHFEKTGNDFKTRITFLFALKGKDFIIDISSVYHTTIQTKAGQLFDTLPNEQATQAVAEIFLKIYYETRGYLQNQLRQDLRKKMIDISPDYAVSLVRPALLSTVN